MGAFHAYITSYPSTKPKMNTAKRVLYKTTSFTDGAIPNVFPFGKSFPSQLPTHNPIAQLKVLQTSTIGSTVITFVG